MNEGKPTKAKWWSRPRTSEDAPDGDFELERPRPAPTPGTDDPATDGGDFELARPAAATPRSPEAGDYELDLPLPERNEPTDAPPHPRTADEAGADPAAGPAVAAGSPRPGGVGAAELPDAGLPRQDDWDRQAAPAVDAGSRSHAGTGSVPAADGTSDTGRPKPLHEPDPYSTPPYGEPGPWAPAPPVQHPAATPAHGTVTAVGGVPQAAPVTPAAEGPHAHVPRPSGSSVSSPAGAVPDPAFADAPPPVPPTAQERHPAPAAPVPHDAGAPADPWGRYDPWAASAQHHDAAGRAPKRRRGPRAKALVGGALLIALVSGGIGGGVGAYLERNGGVGTVELPQAGPEAAERDPDSVAGIAARALPSVVTLHVSGGEAAGTGTGFVLDGRGHILTNNHVVEPAGSGGEITVTFNSGDTAEAEVVGRDSGYDLAVVKVKGVTGLTPMPLGNSENVRVGDPVVAIGAPFDLAGTVTSGIISAKERPITAGGEEGDGSDISYVDALQTDAPINPGNSGGPLLDARGRAIGINSAIRSADSGSAESDDGQAGSIGLGFAIPINQGKRVAEELINTGRAAHPVIGITLDMNYTGDGARVSAKGGDGGPAVTTGGPGAKAGIKPGDVITAVDGQRVHSGEELIVKTRAHRPGDRLELTLERDGKETKVSLVLGSSGDD
ncbi:S1C family serine protease [Streptomyces rubrogriseus]|uniref:S1C family serine protease n=1 Tax=Streptomyces rubrogriseus TaxID=194673 RepID=UPI000D593025|nr:trypsin-like peptidase domain-containing protein [Streptomyces rubrogriseus]